MNSVFSSHFIKALIIFGAFTIALQKHRLKNYVFVVYFKTNIQNFSVLVCFVCGQYKMQTADCRLQTADRVQNAD